MIRIGILTCSHATLHLGCSSSSCLADLQERNGVFARYPKDKRVELLGIASCPGCPTTVLSGKLHREVRALVEAGVQLIHVSSCIVALCAFKEKLMGPLKTKFPGVKLVLGTHDLTISSEEFWNKVKEFSSQPQKRRLKTPAQPILAIDNPENAN